MKLAYLPAYLMGKSLDRVLPGYICLYPAQQAGENIAQNASLLGNQWVCGGLDVCLRRGARDHEVELTGMLGEKLLGLAFCFGGVYFSEILLSSPFYRDSLRMTQ